MEKEGEAGLLDPPDGVLYPVPTIHTEFVRHRPVHDHAEAVAHDLEPLADGEFPGPRGECPSVPGGLLDHRPPPEVSRRLVGRRVLVAVGVQGYILGVPWLVVYHTEQPPGVGRVAVIVPVYGRRYHAHPYHLPIHAALVGDALAVAPVDALPLAHGLAAHPTHAGVPRDYDLHARGLAPPGVGGVVGPASITVGAPVRRGSTIPALRHSQHLVVRAPHRGNTNMFLRVFIICANMTAEAEEIDDS